MAFLKSLWASCVTRNAASYHSKSATDKGSWRWRQSPEGWVPPQLDRRVDGVGPDAVVAAVGDGRRPIVGHVGDDRRLVAVLDNDDHQ